MEKSRGQDQKPICVNMTSKEDYDSNKLKKTAANIEATMHGCFYG